MIWCTMLLKIIPSTCSKLFKFRKYLGRRNWPIPSAGTKGLVLWFEKQVQKMFVTGVLLMTLCSKMWHGVDCFFFLWLDNRSEAGPPVWGFSIAFRHITLGRFRLDEWSARRRDIWQQTLTRDRNPSPPAGFNRQSQQASGRRPTP